MQHVGIESEEKGLTQQTTRSLVQLTQAASRYEAKKVYLFESQVPFWSVFAEQRVRLLGRSRNRSGPQ